MLRHLAILSLAALAACTTPMPKPTNADLQKQVGSTRRPSHLLLLQESLGDHLVDGRFECARHICIARRS